MGVLITIEVGVLFKQTSLAYCLKCVLIPFVIYSVVMALYAVQVILEYNSMKKGEIQNEN